jgi:oligosaccharide repeat unit polymerase
MINLRYTYINNVNNSAAFFNLGISYSIYYFVMFLSIPLLIELIALIYGVNFERLAVEYYFSFDDVYTAQSVLYATLGLVAFIVGYLIVGSRTFYVPTIYKANWESSKVMMVSISLFMAGFMIKIYRYFIGIPDLYKFEGTIVNNPLLAFFISVNPLHAFAILIAIVGYYNSKIFRRTKERKSFFIVVVTMIFIYLLFSLDQVAKTRLLTPFIILMIVRQFYYPISFKKIVLGLSLIMIIVMKIGSVIGAAEGGYQADNSIVGNLRPYMVRISQIQNFTQIVKETDEFLYGHTFLEFIERFKPRSMRTVIVEGNEFGRKYGIISKDDKSTGVAFTNIGDLYINFGLLGIVVGMFVLGVIYKILFNFLINTNMFLTLIFPSLWFVIMHGVESHISIVFYYIVMLFVIMTIIHVVLVDYKYSNK